MNESPPPPDFNRVARLYRWAEYLTLGPLLQRTRLAQLDKLQHCRKALLFGDGDGRFLARLLQQNPELHASAVDTSAVMLHLLSDRCHTDSARITTLRTSALSASIPPGTDLIVTHFFLDCLHQHEVDALARRIATAVSPGSLWLVSDFAIPAHPLLRSPGRLYIRALYLAFRLFTGLRVSKLPDLQTALEATGFRRTARQQKLSGLLYSELWVYDPAADPVERERHNPTVSTLIHSNMEPHDIESKRPPPADFQADPLPDPEPIAPSLDEPDPGVFHHEPGTIQPSA